MELADPVGAIHNTQRNSNPANCPREDNGGDGSIREAFLEQTDLNNLTVKDSLGSTVTIPVAVVRPY